MASRKKNLTCAVFSFILLFSTFACFLFYKSYANHQQRNKNPLLREVIRFEGEDEKSTRIIVKDFNIDEGIQKIKEKMDWMCNQFPGNEEDCFMLKVVESPPPISDKTHALTRKILSKILTEDNTLRAVFTGTSNTAGHGSPYHHSYPLVIQDMLGDIMGQVGINFRSTNTAIGSVGQFPRPLYCQNAAYGENADIMGFEFGMFGASECDQERWIRGAIKTQNNPIFVVPNPGGPSHCANRYTDVFYSSDQKEMLSHLGEPYPEGSKDKNSAWFLTNEWMEASGKTQDDLDALKKWELDEETRKSLHYNAKPSTGSSSALAQVYGDFGYTNLNFGRATGEDSRPFWLIRALLCRAVHHPGTLGHYMIANQIGYWILKHTLAALELMKQHKSAGTIGELTTMATEKNEIPNVLHENCDLPGEKQSQCWMTMEPRLNEPLENLVDPSPTRVNFWGPQRKEGYGDVHEWIEGPGSWTIRFTMEEKMKNNHADGRAWVVLCGAHHKKSKVEIDGEKIIYDDELDMCESNSKWKVLNYEIPDDKPQICGSDAHVNHAMCAAIKPVSCGDHELKIEAEDGFAFKMLFLI